MNRRDPVVASVGWRGQLWIIERVTYAYEERTMATASLRTLSPKSRAYRSTSTLSSLKIASTVTEVQRRTHKALRVQDAQERSAQTSLTRRTSTTNLGLSQKRWPRRRGSR